MIDFAIFHAWMPFGCKRGPSFSGSMEEDCNNSGLSEESGDSITKVKQLACKEQLTRAMVDNPILCYMRCMYGTRPSALLQDVLTSFYAEREINGAKVQLLDDCKDFDLDLPMGVRAKHRATNAMKKSLDAGDLLAILQELDRKDLLDAVPIYVTSSVFRLPTDDPNNKDPLVLQSEIKLLRSEVTSLQKTMNEKMELLRQEFKSDRAENSAPAPVPPPRPSKSPGKSPPIQDKAVTDAKVRLQSSNSCASHPTDWDVPISEKAETQRVDDFLYFFGSESPLSNFHSAKVTMEGETFSTSEHAFQYLRARMAGQYVLANDILRAKQPVDAKRLGDRVVVPADPVSRGTWEVKLGAAMEAVCKQKFLENTALREYLLKTKERVLVEASRDKLWGCGLPANDVRIKDKNMWTGSNLLGQVLMRVRESLISNTDSAEHVFDFFTLDNDKSSQGGYEHEKKKHTFSELVKKPGPWKLVETLKRNKVIKTLGSNSTTKGLIGVEKVSQADFYIGQVQAETTQQDLIKFLKDAGVEVSQCFKLNSRVMSSSAFRIRCDTKVVGKILDESFWPTNIVIRRWIRKPKLSGH